MFELATVSSFAGLAAALGVVVAAVVRLRRGFGWLPLGYAAVAVWYAITLIQGLIRQSTGIVCAIPAWRTLLVYGGLLVLHLWSLYDLLHALCAPTGKKEEGQDER